MALHLVFGVHCHQPIGNLHHIVERTYQDAYLPFMQEIRRFPGLRITMHLSGCLLDWFEAYHPDYLEQIKEAVQDGQVELLAGGYYEPVLPMLYHRDRVRQIEVSREYHFRQFGDAPEGMWLPERVWEPSLPYSLRQAGITYAFLDDYHFRCTGIPQERLYNYFVTEDRGQFVDVFPINERMRYIVPFKPVEQVIDYLRELHNTLGDVAIVGIGDGEKFGAWEGMHDWIYNQGWLRRFLEALEANSDWLQLMHPRAARSRFDPQEVVYLPTAAYPELTEWVLPEPAARKLRNLRESQGQDEVVGQFIRGGFFRNFFTKYPESNYMHKRMLAVSALLKQVRLDHPRRDWHEAERHLLQGQCNNAYWRGEFSGLDLPFLRRAVYSHLIRAQTLIEDGLYRGNAWGSVRRRALFGTTIEDVILDTKDVGIVYSPEEGGHIREVDFKPLALNVTDVLSRRPEVFESSRAGTPIHDNGPKTNAVTLLLSRAEDLQEYQDDPSRNLRPRFRGTPTVQVFESHDFLEVHQTQQLATRDGSTLELEKTLLLRKRRPELQILTRLRGTTMSSFVPALEFAFSFPDGCDANRQLRFPEREGDGGPVGRPRLEDGVGEVVLSDDWERYGITVTAAHPSTFMSFPIETRVTAGGGHQQAFQGVVLVVGGGEQAPGPVDVRQSLTLTLFRQLPGA